MKQTQHKFGSYRQNRTLEVCSCYSCEALGQTAQRYEISYYYADMEVTLFFARPFKPPLSTPKL